MTVNLTNITNIDSFYDWGLYASKSTGGLFYGAILIAFFIIIIVRTRHYGTDRAVMAASFACLLVSLILLNLQFVQLLYPIFFGLALAGSAFYSKFIAQTD